MCKTYIWVCIRVLWVDCPVSKRAIVGSEHARLRLRARFLETPPGPEPLKGVVGVDMVRSRLRSRIRPRIPGEYYHSLPDVEIFLGPVWSIPITLKLTSGWLIGAKLGLLDFCRALICNRALNGALHIGQLFAWYLRESAHELHRHKCLQGRIKVSRTSHMQITHSEPLSSVSSSPPA